MSDPAEASPRDYLIRSVTPDDMDVLANLVRELAVYEKVEDLARGTAADFRRNLFGTLPAAEAAIVEFGGEAIGFALWFGTFSTYRAKPGIYLEDLFVRPEHRGRGIGKAVLAMLARLTLERGGDRLNWSVLRWNEPAIGFYRALGAEPVDQWIGFRLDGEPLGRLAAVGRRFDERSSDRKDAPR